VGIGPADTVGGGETDDKSCIVMLYVERGIACPGVDDGALEGDFVVLVAGSEQQQDCGNNEFRKA
jgi:hypothetical protein